MGWKDKVIEAFKEKLRKDPDNENYKKIIDFFKKLKTFNMPKDEDIEQYIRILMESLNKAIAQDEDIQESILREVETLTRRLLLDAKTRAAGRKHRCYRYIHWDNEAGRRRQLVRGQVPSQRQFRPVSRSWQSSLRLDNARPF